MISIEEKEFRRLLRHIKTFIEKPQNKAARTLARISLETLQGYDTEEFKDSVPSEILDKALQRNFDKDHDAQEN